MHRRIPVGIAASVLSVLASVIPARAAESVIVTGPGGRFSTYTQVMTAVQVGEPLTFVNGDIERHDVVASNAKAPHQCPAQPGLCSPDVPSWCMPPDPSRPWTTNPNENPLPYPPGACPMFWSPIIGVGKTTQVLGTKYLEAGETYRFSCSQHGAMFGYILALPTA